MLLRFLSDKNLAITIYGELSGGSVRNIGGLLEEGKPLGNISYESLAALRDGVIDWDNTKKTGVILEPNDPRSLSAPYPPPKAYP